MDHLNIKVIGEVQGVFFRKYTQEKALALGISGIVQNELDGSVFIEAEGFEEQLTEFVEWLKEGSPKSNVKEVIVKKGVFQDYEYFDINYL